VLLAALGTEAGMLRVVRGPPRRDGGRLPRRWAGVEIVVRDVDALLGHAAALPAFAVLRPAVTIDLSDVGSLVHRSGVVMGPGGLQLMVTQPLSQPRGRAFHRAVGDAGPIFAVHLRADRGVQPLSLYRDALGLRSLVTLTFDRGWWHDFWRLPPGHVEVSVLSGGGHGTVEVQVYEPAVLDTVGAPPDRLEGGIGLVTLTVPGSEEARCIVGPAGERLELV